MSPVRRRLPAIPVTIAALVLMVSGCSGAGTSFDGTWDSADEVVADVTDGGFDCSFDESQKLKQVLTEHPVTKEPLGGSLVLCQGFQVLLLDDPADYTATLRKDCATVTTQSLESPAVSRVVVVGDNFVISGTGPDQAFPEGSPSSELATSFAGEEKTLLEYYQELCDGIPPVEGSPAPT